MGNSLDVLSEPDRPKNSELLCQARRFRFRARNPSASGTYWDISMAHDPGSKRLRSSGGSNYELQYVRDSPGGRRSRLPFLQQGDIRGCTTEANGKNSHINAF